MFHHKQSIRKKLIRIPGLQKLVIKVVNFRELAKMFEAICYVDPMEIEDYMVSISILSFVNAFESCFCLCLWFCSSF